MQRGGDRTGNHKMLHVLLTVIILLVVSGLTDCSMNPEDEVYTIQYVLNGGINGDNPATYSSGDSLITLQPIHPEIV